MHAKRIYEPMADQKRGVDADDLAWRGIEAALDGG